MTTPSPDDLTDADVAAIVRAQDEARVRLDEIHARDPSLRGIQDTLDEQRDAVEPVIAAFQAAGLDRQRASDAATAWVIERLDPVACVRAADETAWRRPEPS